LGLLQAGSESSQATAYVLANELLRTAELLRELAVFPLVDHAAAHCVTLRRRELIEERKRVLAFVSQLLDALEIFIAECKRRYAQPLTSARLHALSTSALSQLVLSDAKQP
jgi:hypothetical protein